MHNYPLAVGVHDERGACHACGFQPLNFSLLSRSGGGRGGKRSHQFLKFGVYGHLRMREDDTPLDMGYETTRETAQIKGDSALFLLLSAG
jgi:hypothetical protein